MAELEDNIRRAIKDFDNIKAKLDKLYEPLPEGTDTSLYPTFIELACDSKYNGGFSKGLDSGRETGYKEGVEAGVEVGKEQGKQAEYDTFWDAFQDNGNRTEYAACFGGGGWNIETFKPKYNIAPYSTAYMLFREHNIMNEPYDLVEHLANLGVSLDFSECTFANYVFSSANFSRIGIIKFTVHKNLTNCFDNCKAETIDKIILKADGTNTFSGVFNNCKNLKNITFEGVIGKNGLNFQWSPLTIESLRSIISCLKDYSTDTSGTQWVVTVGSTNLAKLTQDDLNNIQSKGWEFK